ncbi:unnamed protein product [Anisakis simplex]|uniref:Uncharacterized protein n=1 Tax=Anisakis simplex TaxID=6269 RepID=A0A0M3K4V9_ANISI|nr:unnamed protein product [Anisakis simplex]
MRSSLFRFIVLVIVVTVNAGYVKEIARRYRPRNHSSPRDSNDTEQQFANRTLNFPTNVDTAMCGEPKFADFIDAGLRHYQHDMGQLSKYILDQKMIQDIIVEKLLFLLA